jgi:hypothetical protein
MNYPAAHALPDGMAPHDGLRERPPLVVFGALRWGFVWQRSQQLLTRIAKRYRVLYVEEPRTTHQDPWLEATLVAPGLEVLVAHTRCDAPGFHDDQLPVMGGLLAGFLRERGIAGPLAWLDTPAALPLAEGLRPRALVYDCHEDVAAASDDDALREREARLLRLADVVLAGGPSLYESLRRRHSNVHCIANGVDAGHFAPPAPDVAAIEAVSARAIHASIPNPRLGFHGVIDERVDLELLARIAELRPDWQFLLAGPLRGIAPEALPQRGNLQWLGPQTHAILPHLQAHWDICLLPFKPATCTRHAAPIEALEFLAGQKSVVCTPVHDVSALHGKIVRIADGPEAFVEACRAAMCERGPLRRQRRIDALIAVHSASWERAVERVHRLLVEFAHEPADAFAPPLLATSRPRAPRVASYGA